MALAIRQAVEQGDLLPNAKLPPVRDLAWALKITPGTVARAYSILTQEGLLQAAVGRGTFVAELAASHCSRSLPNDGGALTWKSSQDSEIVDLNSPRLPDRGQVSLIRQAFEVVGRDHDTDFMNYPTRNGFRPARQAILKWLQDTPIGHTEDEDLVLCHGAQNGNSIVMQTVLQGARPVVAVEELSYPGFRRAAELVRARVVAVPMDAHGIVPEALERIVRDLGVQLLCTSAEVHNPTGLFTPIERREEIAQVALRTGLHILEDDCYRLGKSQAPHYRALLPEQGWYVSSISKSLTPALRVGFAIAPRPLRSQLRRSVEHGFFGLARPLADVVEHLLNDPRTELASEAICEEVNRYIRAAVNILGGFDLAWRDGMPLLWLQLPEGWRAAAFVQAADGQGVSVRSADDFALRDGHPPHAVRLGINAQVSLASFEAALGRLRVLLDNPPERIAV
ncbi:aminotransferase-like domain-containing protein [Pseudoprimorskyibacter insulae]|uniref:aminotransferase-like domain-containing protein n=1 Tax=Pseudoprimorskyibacter insulae TaxID=1695997 RepID=UPI002795E979|nr:PLP-dependent aminotransferase family protein [Pseudoprimorskyibacter insulae]